MSSLVYMYFLGYSWYPRSEVNMNVKVDPILTGSREVPETSIESAYLVSYKFRDGVEHQNVIMKPLAI